MMNNNNDRQAAPMHDGLVAFPSPSHSPISSPVLLASTVAHRETPRAAAAFSFVRMAYRAGLWYNKRVKIVVPGSATNTPGWMHSLEEYIMDIIPQDDTPRKQCTNPHCQQWLPATPEFFYRQTARKDGLSSRCKTCLSGENRAYYAAHPEKAREYHKQYYPAHQEERIQYSRNYRAEHPEEIKQSIAQYREEHREEILRAKAQYNAEHREERIDYARQWHQEHKEEQLAYYTLYNQGHREERLVQYRRYNQEHREERNKKTRLSRRTERGRMMHRTHENNRRARKLATTGTYTPQDIQSQYDRQKGRCYWCHIVLKNYHVDHIIPLSRGGTNWSDNLVIACPPCNMTRNNKLPHEFYEGGKLL